MGVETHRAPRPPAATDDSTDLGTISGGREEEIPTSGGSGEEIGTELSRRTDQTHWSLPEDGSPVDIPVQKRRGKGTKEHGTLTRGSNKSQTSLLIEYFEGGKGPNVHSRPSVRVKVTPSAARKIKGENEHIRVSESKGGRKPSYTKRIELGKHSPSTRRLADREDEASLSGSYTSAAEQSSLTHRRPPVEIEVLPGDGSDLSTLSERPVHQLGSEVSSMPPDSMLEETHRTVVPKRTRSRSLSREATVTDTLKAPSRRRSRSLSKERLVQKAMEKVAARPVEGASGRVKRSSKTRSRSISDDHIETSGKTRRRSSRHHDEPDLVSGTDGSILTNSALSPRRQSGDQYSFRSGTSKSSLNANPRLLETVENAIRRLIMPELENLKQEQRIQKTRSKFEQDPMASTSSVSRSGELSRKLSKHASAPDVSGKPKVVLNRDENHAGTILSGDSVKGRKEHRRPRKSDSPSERSFERGLSEETVVRDGHRSSRKGSGHRLRDTAAGGMAGGILTAAALNHHDMKHADSRSSLDREKRRRRRSKSHSRSASLAGTDEIFNKHDVPPMPMRSDIHSSDVTRDSILSERTDAPSTPVAEVRMAEVQHVTRGSPREIDSPAARTPTKNPRVHGSLGMHHSNQSQNELSPRHTLSERGFHDSGYVKSADAGLLGAGAGITGGLAAHELSRRHDNEHEYTYGHERRGLSPIQSVSSRADSELKRASYGHQRSVESLASLQRQGRRKSGTSIKSIPSAADIRFDHSNRPKGMNFEPRDVILGQHELRDSQYTEGSYSEKDPAMEEWLQQEHEKNDRYRESLDESGYRNSIGEQHRQTGYTDDTVESSRDDEAMAGQPLKGGAAAKNPDYRSTPVAVESAVASLVNTSVISGQGSHGEQGHRDLQGDAYPKDSAEIQEHLGEDRSTDDLHESKVEAGHARPVSERSRPHTLGLTEDSPRHSEARSLKDSLEHISMGATGIPLAHDPIPEIGHGLQQSDSDISTNPSIIQGPMGGPQAQNTDHWAYGETPTHPDHGFITRSKDASAHDTLKAAAAGFLGTAALANDSRERQGSPSGVRVTSSIDGQEVGNELQSPREDRYMHKDEGYVSGAQQRGGLSPGLAFKDARDWNDGDVDFDGPSINEDPFVTGKNHARHLSTNSGLAGGMGSPLYDSATGEGLDRIPSKDIVALMDHLTVRDAQRNARDTEILVTLVRSAAEMRNSFEEMKKFIAEQDDIIVEQNNQQHDRTIHKIMIGGPRPQPPGAPRVNRQVSAEDEGDDAAAKKRSIFRRALKGLGNRNQNDIGRIEERLEQLLMEVQGLKVGQDVRQSGIAPRRDSLDSYNEARAVAPEGYEPEGRANTGSTKGSGYFSNPPSRGPSAMRGVDVRHGSQNRVSTVMEADEELDEHERMLLDRQFENDEQLLTPTQEHHRSGSVPLSTPPRTRIPPGVHSADQTPVTSTDKSGQRKSNSSSFIPKVSRWSKTTASSVGDRFRNTRDRPFSEASRSGELQSYDDEHYEPHGDDRIRSNESFVNDPAHTARAQAQAAEAEETEERPRSPLIPSQISTVSEDPKYRSVRDSINLQHPQPRPGPTQRYQNQLESQAQKYGSRSPISPTSDTFGSDPALARYMPVAHQRYSGHTGTLSPVMSEAGYSDVSSLKAGPPRPPKIPDDGPLVPAGSSSTVTPGRSSRSAVNDHRPTFASPLSTEHLQPEQQYGGTSSGSTGNAKNDSSRAPSGTMPPQRKPTGPRPITSSGSYSPDKDGVRRTRYRGSPHPMDSPPQSVDETF